MSQAIIRGMQDEQNQQFVAYFLPVGFHSASKKTTILRRKKQSRNGRKINHSDSTLTTMLFTITSSQKSTIGTSKTKVRNSKIARIDRLI